MQGRQRVESGHNAAVPSINVYTPKRSSSLGVVSLILGIVAFLVCWIPLIGLLSMPLSGLGVLLAILGVFVALFRSGSGIGWPIGGGVVSLVALIIALAQVAVIGGTAKKIQRVTERIAVRPNVGDFLGQASESRPAQNPDGQSNENGNDTDIAQRNWLPGTEPVRTGNVQLEVTRAIVGQVPLVAGFCNGQTTSENELLALHISMSNISETRKIDYRTWRGGDMSFTRDHATLSDSFGNQYRRISFSIGASIVGATNSASIYPQDTVNDVLVFEKPLENAEYLTLELPAENVGDEGVVRLRIPNTLIEDR